MSVPQTRLTSTSYALLGAVAQAGSCSPYELKRVLASTVGMLWEVPHSQIYDESARLAKAGLLIESQEGSGRRRLNYTVTDAGRRELLRWLRMPSSDRIEFRDIGLLKLAFAAELQPAELRHVAQDHVEQWTAVGEELRATMQGRSALYTIALAHAAAAFWGRLRDELEDRGDDPASNGVGSDRDLAERAAELSGAG